MLEPSIIKKRIRDLQAWRDRINDPWCCPLEYVGVCNTLKTEETARINAEISHLEGIAWRQKASTELRAAE